MWIIGFVLFAVGIILVIAASVNKKKHKRCSAETQGMLKDIFKTDSSGGEGHAYLYTYLVNGTEYQLKSTAASPQTNNIGDQCIIWYNPAKPKEAMVYHPSSMKTYNILLIIGIVMIPLGLFLTVLGAVQQSM